LAGRLDGGDELVQSLDTKRGGPDDNEAQAGHLVVSPTLRVGPAKIADGGPGDTVPLTVGPQGEDDPLLPLGLDSHRYRCCGNGVVAPVAQWIGRQLLAAIGDAGFGEAG
jgi:site-specific DNA-cytosine methylase